VLMCTPMLFLILSTCVENTGSFSSSITLVTRFFKHSGNSVKSAVTGIIQVVLVLIILTTLCSNSKTQYLLFKKFFVMTGRTKRLSLTAVRMLSAITLPGIKLRWWSRIRYPCLLKGVRNCFSTKCRSLSA